MNGKLLWRTGMTIVGGFILAVLVRNCKEIRTDHEMQLRDHDILERMQLGREK